MTGTVKFFNVSKGFGFITNDETGEDMFVHSTALDGITISQEQFKYINDNKSNQDNFNIQLKDYRHVEGQFDRVYSVGMFEHVGRKRYKEYYDKCFDLLKNEDRII